MPLSSAFKRDAERIAEDTRGELGIGNLAALDPLDLLDHLEVPTRSLGSLASGRASDDPVRAAAHYLRNDESFALSAMTVFDGTRRLVVYNDAHDVGRRASDLTHEAAHALLMHTPGAVIDERGCRLWDQAVEDEANWLGGALLIPGKAARYAAKAGWTFAQMAHKFGCSEDMARWRNNDSGGQRLRR